MSTKPGFGIGFRLPHFEWIIREQPKVGFFEVVTDDFIFSGGRPRNCLKRLREAYPITLHGVALSIGSTTELSKKYLTGLKELCDAFEPISVSDHLCFTHHNGTYSHDLLPVPLTHSTLQQISKKIDQIQNFLGREIALENPSLYLQPASQKYGEAEFLRELQRKTGCKLLLDLNNLIVNENNVGSQPEDFFETFSESGISYFHLAGHKIDSGVRIDTHDQRVPKEVFNLFGRAVKHWPSVPAVLEWDGNLPSFEKLLEEMKTAEEIRNSVASSSQTEFSFEKNREPMKKGPKFESARAECFQAELISAITSPKENIENLVSLVDDQTPVSTGLGYQVYHSSYWRRLESSLADLYPNLSSKLSKEEWTELSKHYFSAFPPPSEFLKDIGKNLPKFLADLKSPLADMAEIEWIRTDLYDSPDVSQVTNPTSVLDLQNWTLTDWEGNRLKVQLPHRQTRTRFFCRNKSGEVLMRELFPIDQTVIQKIHGSTFGEICEWTSQKHPEALPEVISQKVVEWIRFLSEQGGISIS